MPDNLSDARFSDGSLISPALKEGVRLFNAGEFFDCHEVLEDAWREEHGPLRDLYQGLIKAAVSFYHAENDNLEGAIKVMRSGLPQLHPYINWNGLELDTFVPQLERCLEAFLSLETTSGHFDPKHIPALNLRA